MNKKSMDRLRDDLTNRFGRVIMILLRLPISLVNLIVRWCLIMKSWSIMCRA